ALENLKRNIEDYHKKTEGEEVDEDSDNEEYYDTSSGRGQKSWMDSPPYSSNCQDMIIIFSGQYVQCFLSDF
ncbi:hypothetical protein L9F63_025646, partial [Diploptera punctata]